MSPGATSEGAAGDESRAFVVLVYAAQFFFGGWFLYNGLNYWVQFFPQPPGSSALAYQLISALIDTGLFGIVKGLEIVIGIALLANRFVPLAIVAAFTVSISIAHMNIVNVQDPLGIGTGVVIMLLNIIMAIGHLDKFLPLIEPNNGDPSMKGLKMFFSRFGK